MRHQAGATDEILAFLGDAGLDLGEDLRVYEDNGDPKAIGDALVAEGFKLYSPYPLRKGRFDDSVHLVPPDLYKRLNSKANLPDLVPEGALGPRQMFAVDGPAPSGPLPAYVKSADAEATGWGFAVRYCESAADIAAAQAAFAAKGVQMALLEQAMDVTCSWCANLVVEEDGATYLGAAEQLFKAPGQQSGSLIDPDNPFPKAGIEIALIIAEKARVLGYRGVFGLDFGLCASGQLVVFDPNFRMNSCTPQIFLQDSVQARGLGGVSLSFAARSTRSTRASLAAVQGAVDDGWFVPWRVLDPAYFAAAEGLCHLNGFVAGRTRAEAEARAASLATRLAA